MKEYECRKKNSALSVNHVTNRFYFSFLRNGFSFSTSLPSLILYSKELLGLCQSLTIFTCSWPAKILRLVFLFSIFVTLRLKDPSAPCTASFQSTCLDLDCALSNPFECQRCGFTFYSMTFKKRFVSVVWVSIEVERVARLGVSSLYPPYVLLHFPSCVKAQSMKKYF